MAEITVDEKTFVYANGTVVVAREDGGWRWIVLSGTIRLDCGEDRYVTWQAARANAWLAFEALGGRND